MDTLPPHDQNGNLKKFYVYTLAYPDGRVFYVGKGTGRRIHFHEKEARKDKQENPYKCNIIRKIWAECEEVVKTKLAHFADEQEAFLYEISLIFLMDGLTNLNDGGSGQSNPSEEVRRKMSESARNKPPISEETRMKLSTSLKGNQRSKGITLSEDAKRKISKTHKGRPPGTAGKPVSEETRQKLREKSKGRAFSDAHRRNLSEGLKGHIVSEETRQKISEANKGKTLSEEAKTKIGEASRKRQYPKGYALSEETKHKMSLAHKGRSHTEETKHKMSEIAKQREAAKRDQSHSERSA